MYFVKVLQNVLQFKIHFENGSCRNASVLNLRCLRSLISGKLKLNTFFFRIVDSIQECCHCDNSAVCISSVQLIADLLTSVEQLVKGQGLSDNMVEEIHAQYKETDGELRGGVLTFYHFSIQLYIAF